MILDQNKVRRLLQNAALSVTMPELSLFVDQAKAVKSMVLTGGCRPCQENAKMMPIVTRAQDFISRLSPERISVLKSILGVRDRLFSYSPGKHGKPGLVELK